MEDDIINILKNATPILKPILGDFSGIPKRMNLMEYAAITTNRNKVIRGIAKFNIFLILSGNRL